MNNNISQLTISYNDHSIRMNGNELYYHNTISPSLSGRLRLPAEYFEERHRNLTEIEKTQITNCLIENLEKLSDEDCAHDTFIGADYKILTCEFEDGDCFKYRTHLTPADAFVAIASQLESLCNFPAIPAGELLNTELAKRIINDLPIQEEQ